MFLDHAEMSAGEQALLEGLLAMLKPKLAIEIGTFTGGSLRRIAAHSEEVHTFDLATHVDERFPNVTYHLGDSAVEVPRLLSTLASEGRTVDFALVDGDHAREGVHQDALNLLASPTTHRTVIAFHDIANEDVRAGVRDALKGFHDLSYVDLSFSVPSGTPSPLRESWGGIGVVVRDPEAAVWPTPRGVRPNVGWRTTTKRSLVWSAAVPVREVKRRAAYRLRPAVRRFRGTRGVKGPS
jgi:hypothetical protein